MRRVIVLSGRCSRRKALTGEAETEGDDGLAGVETVGAAGVGSHLARLRRAVRACERARTRAHVKVWQQQQAASIADLGLVSQSASQPREEEKKRTNTTRKQGLS